MPLNQTDVAVDEELEKVIIAIDSSTETDFGDYESGYEYSSGECSFGEIRFNLTLKKSNVLYAKNLTQFIETSKMPEKKQFGTQTTKCREKPKNSNFINFLKMLIIHFFLQISKYCNSKDFEEVTMRSGQ